MGDNTPKDTFLWKLKLQKYGADYANSRIHAVKAEVLVLASGKDSMFLSGSEAQRLSRTIPNCNFRYFKDSKHNLLMEDGINLLTIIKGTFTYRRSRRRDCVSDFLPPSMSEYNNVFNGSFGIIRLSISPVMFSTMEDGKIVRGLRGVPNEGPVLLVGYHMLFGSEISSLIQEFLREKNIMVHGMAHLEMFTSNFEEPSKEFSHFDYFKVLGALPVTARNLFKLFSTKSYAVLYPGGIREALHRKGEKYKLFWPDQPEFVRMAAKFGATIVPFGAVGEDDVVELFLDYNDQMRIPFLNDHIRQQNGKAIKLRTEKGGEVSNEDFFVPGFYPKIPGRFYFLFGKPIETKGKEDMLKDEDYRKSFYLQIKSEVENAMAYLTKKREEDPYRGILERTVYRAVSAPVDNVPSFEP